MTSKGDLVMLDSRVVQKKPRERVFCLTVHTCYIYLYLPFGLVQHHPSRPKMMVLNLK